MSNEWVRLPLEGRRVRIEAGEREYVVVQRETGDRVGTVVIEEQGDVLFVRQLEIEPGSRGYGLGSEVARLLRAAAEQGHWRTLRAWAPPDIGLAVYFWSRMGLRPLAGAGPNGGLWFERSVG
jgi:GNAT superfamily N-acetyltransferase